jgi:hypothetical protein
VRVLGRLAVELVAALEHVCGVGVDVPVPQVCGGSGQGRGGRKQYERNGVEDENRGSPETQPGRANTRKKVSWQAQATRSL